MIEEDTKGIYLVNFEKHQSLDKMERLKYLCQAPKDCGDESMRDTLVDMANYAVMTIMELDSLEEKRAKALSKK